MTTSLDVQTDAPALTDTVRELVVTRVTLEAKDVISLCLQAPDREELAPWEPGAHLDLELPSGLLRQYSLCGDPSDRTSYTIAVLRNKDGRGGSAELHDHGMVGRVMRVRAMRNHFALESAPAYMFIAGGIGVTPLLSMAQSVVHEAEPWSFHYIGRERERMAFVEDIISLRPDSVAIHVREEGDVVDVDSLIAETAADASVYCCGPERLMQAVEEACARADPPRRFHMERFGAAASLPVAPEGSAGDAPFTVTLAHSGAQLSVPTDRTVLDVVRDTVPSVPFSCEEGYCGSCETRVLGGIPDHRDDILSDAEKAANDTMFICVSRSKSPDLVLDL